MKLSEHLRSGSKKVKPIRGWFVIPHPRGGIWGACALATIVYDIDPHFFDQRRILPITGPDMIAVVNKKYDNILDSTDIFDRMDDVNDIIKKATEKSNDLASVIIDLNDKARMGRESIAFFLEKKGY